MPTIYVKLQFNSQMGYNDTGANYTSSGFNYGLKTDRVIIFRYQNIPVPRGSTINSATLYTVHSAKNATGTAYTFTQSLYTDKDVAATQWLDSTRNEWNARETWVGHGSSNWAWGQGGASRQLHSHNAKPALDTLIAHASWTRAGGAATFLLYYPAVSHPNDIYIHAMEDRYGPMLEINYTPPASDGLDSVVNLQENCTFDRTTNSTGAFDIAPYGHNPWFGAFAPPTYTVHTTGIPTGNSKVVRALKVTSGADAPYRSMVHTGAPVLREGRWYNASGYVYVPSGSPDVEITVLGGKTRDAGAEPVTQKDQWVRTSINFLPTEESSNWITFQQVNGPYATGNVFWLANVQITEGRILRPYIDGRQSLTGAIYGWAGPVGYGGYVRAAPPQTPVVAAQPDKARRKYYAPSWSYYHGLNHLQAGAEIKVRKIR